MKKCSVIIPTLNEAACIGETLAALQGARGRGHELIVVDGGSTDNTCGIAENQVDRMLQCAPGRARQMNRGAEVAGGDIYVFLHADTVPGPEFDTILSALSPSGDAREEGFWGWFDLSLSGERPIYRCIEALTNIRSRLTGIATGDQAVFTDRALFRRLSGYADIPLMEDVEFTARLRKISPPVCIDQAVVSSSRRWESRGVVRTILLMWALRFCYAAGFDPHTLARWYD